ncbi:sigma factor-like helix-turn-helix DNA-binding protein [Brevibacillus laterosporus]|uniref:Sigma factor-like helix-turn-helix DNA-binding protein n=1 Tax=Brevibacillus laterosporus TaxID=1465 RepID=A0AAP3DKX7_BRELA|nr:sigma factor-like helix-turn-helix DNA-binding protein [Brevibacillus laterosporus]MCR8983213.1 RNA polymerase subunit sigma-24 [Brevibacillus laterosporus]MCZ0810369.1 sigma factor-like helix-turn-helix DNA-binding protein [Brevibacillus laterosporus]MCZ0828257.1 sigma factor-like helix-turn-helix DNA-binding protein [Brevibacillus laterosporus]MCZ0853093.1 sigma factor-like helix-turn-helix DNA-binding protein [Brevibacillus laterosporus]
MQDLLREYEYTKMQLEAKRRLLKKENTSKDEINVSDIELLGEMISSVDFIIEWIKTGKRPGKKRGIERRAAYEREILVDPITIQSYVNNGVAGSPANITDSQRKELEEALSILSKREKECYTLAHGRGFTQYEVANLLLISRGTVDKYIRRAQEKISRYLQLKK